jgi:hypothetical protein
MASVVGLGLGQGHLRQHRVDGGIDRGLEPLHDVARHHPQVAEAIGRGGLEDHLVKLVGAAGFGPGHPPLGGPAGRQIDGQRRHRRAEALVVDHRERLGAGWGGDEQSCGERQGKSA